MGSFPSASRKGVPGCQVMPSLPSEIHELSYGWSNTEGTELTTYGPYYEGVMYNLENSVMKPLTEEFSRLIGITDTLTISKAVALSYLCENVVDPKKDDINFDMVDEPPRRYSLQMVMCCMRIFGDDKTLNPIWNFSAPLNSDLLVVKDFQKLIDENKMADHAFYPQNNRTVRSFVKALCEKSQVECKPGSLKNFTCSYKSLQSIFNKFSVRRGQTKKRIVGDLWRGTLCVDTEEQLDKLVSWINIHFRDNFDLKLGGRETIEKLDLEQWLIKAKTAKTMWGCGTFDWKGGGWPEWRDWSEGCREDLEGDKGVLVHRGITPYRFVANTSQEGKRPRLYNLNFFIDYPKVQICGDIVIIGAGELQIGLQDTVTELRKDHRPYEQERLQKALPSVGRFIEWKKGGQKEEFGQKVDYDRINKCFRDLYSPEITAIKKLCCSTTIKGYDHKQVPLLPCINSFRVNLFRHSVPIEPPTKPDTYPKVNEVWSEDLDKQERYVINELKVKIKDQGWGNTGFVIFFVAYIADYMVELSNRALLKNERKHDWIYLVKDTYNLSQFLDNTSIPVGTHKVALLVAGLLTGINHECTFSGLELHLGVLKK